MPTGTRHRRRWPVHNLSVRRRAHVDGSLVLFSLVDERVVTFVRLSDETLDVSTFIGDLDGCLLQLWLVLTLTA